MKPVLRLCAFATILACAACSNSGDGSGSSASGGVSEADCHAVIARGYELQGFTGPDLTALVDDQSKACGKHNDLTAKDVACAKQASNPTEMAACVSGKTLH